MTSSGSLAISGTQRHAMSRWSSASSTAATSVADGGGFIQARAADALEEIGARRGEQGEIGIVVDGLDLRGSFEGGLGFFEFDVGLVGDEFGGDEDASVDEHDAETLTDGGRIFAPRLAEIE